MSRVTLRKVPGFLTLGLLASLTAHAALFGGRHAVGGAYHAIVLPIALAAALGFVAFVAALAWTQSRSATDGSILAARLRERLPNVASVIAASAILYVAVEAVEPHHAGAPALVLLAVLATASYVVLRLAHSITAALARVTIAVSRASFSPNAPAWRRRARGRVIVRRVLNSRRRFARPPPIASALLRA